MTEKVLYLEDKQGSIPPEIKRYMEVSGYAHRLCYASRDVNNAASDMLKMAEQLGPNRGFDEDGKKAGYTFPSESSAQEQLIKLAGLMRRLNVKIWAVSRALGKDAEDLAARIQIADDQEFDAELQKYLESDPSAQP